MLLNWFYEYKWTIQSFLPVKWAIVGLCTFRKLLDFPNSEEPRETMKHTKKKHENVMSNFTGLGGLIF